MKNVVAKKSLKSPEESGRYWRLICLSGPNKGTAYYLEGSRILMGRSDKTDIQIIDKKSSREHCELSKIGKGYILTDLNSQNGIIINEKKIRQKKLRDGNKFKIGQTVYKYEFIKVKGALGLIGGDLDEDDEEYEYEDEDEEGSGGEKKISKGKKKMFIMLFGILAVMYLMEDDGSSSQKSAGSKKAISKSIDSKFENLKEKKKMGNKEIEEKLGVRLQRGLREYRERNYFRAINEFNLALMLSPNHGRASFYLRKTKQALDAEVKKNFLRSRRERDALKYRASIVSNCAIIKLLEGYQSDERYKEAEMNVKDLETLLGMEEGEAKCTKE